MEKQKETMTMVGTDFGKSVMMKNESAAEKMLHCLNDKIMFMDYEVEQAKISCFDGRNDKTLHWAIINEREIKCQVLMGKLELLKSLQKEFKQMLPETTEMAAA